ncbi:MAG: hypothetical protein HC944_06615 [Nanoarchaeota archaeon]|nr:hypothetical protein [Nanoarchaeota archaeon]
MANVIEKYVQDDEKKFASVTLDDASGQIKAKAFGDDIQKFQNLEQGDTIGVIGLLRQWNQEIYILPEIMKKKDPAFLLVRKLELDSEKPKTLDPDKRLELKDKILDIIKREEEKGGADIEKMILD